MRAVVPKTAQIIEEVREAPGAERSFLAGIDTVRFLPIVRPSKIRTNTPGMVAVEVIGNIVVVDNTMVVVGSIAVAVAVDNIVDIRRRYYRNSWTEIDTPQKRQVM